MYIPPCVGKNFKFRPKKVVLFLKIGRVKLFLSFTRSHSWMCMRIYLFNFKKQTNEQKKKRKKKQEYKNKPKKQKKTKQKKLKKKSEHLRNINLKNKFAATLAKIFLVTRISGNKNLFWPYGVHITRKCIESMYFDSYPSSPLKTPGRIFWKSFSPKQKGMKKTMICFIKVQPENVKMTWNIRLFIFYMICNFSKCDCFTVLLIISTKQCGIKFIAAPLQPW